MNNLKDNFIYNGAQNNKISRNKCDQVGKNLSTKNYKTLLKYTKVDLTKWKDISCFVFFLEDSTIKIGIIPKAIYRFNTCKKSSGFLGQKCQSSNSGEIANVSK